MDNVFLQRQEGFAVCSSSRFFRRPSLNRDKDEKVSFVSSRTNQYLFCRLFNHRISLLSSFFPRGTVSNR